MLVLWLQRGQICPTYLKAISESQSPAQPAQLSAQELPAIGHGGLPEQVTRDEVLLLSVGQGVQVCSEVSPTAYIGTCSPANGQRIASWIKTFFHWTGSYSAR